jgi:hypothetical protein
VNRLCFSLLVVSCLVSAFFCGKVAWSLLGYFSLDSQEKAVVDSWQIVKKGDSSFAIAVEYRFVVKGVEHKGKVELAKPYFLNPYAAKKAIEQLSRENWTVFFNAKKITENSLQKNFPFQPCIQAFLTLCLCIYFTFLQKWWKSRFA